MANLTSLGSVLKPSGLIQELNRAAQGLNSKPYIKSREGFKGFWLNPKA